MGIISRSKELGFLFVDKQNSEKVTKNVEKLEIDGVGL